jgi:Na+/citrate or Na+/malate symporter
MGGTKKVIKIMGLELKYFLFFTVVLVAATVTGILPDGMGGALYFAMIVGALLNVIGDNLPIVKDYFGGGSVVIIFGCAALTTYGIFPQEVVDNVGSFFSGDMDFINFALSMMISGSILGTSKELLKKAALRFVPTLIGAQLFVMIFAGIAALITGYDLKQAILYIAIPITGGGMSAGAIPLSQIYEGTLGIPADQTLSVMAPAIALANALAIILSGIISNIVKNKPKLTGYGQIMPYKKNDMEEEKESFLTNYGQIGTGFVIAFSFLILGKMCGKLIPQFHAYAFMVIIVVIVKLTGILPKKYEEACVVFYSATIANVKNVILVCIGITLINLNSVFSVLSPAYFIIVLFSSFGAFFGAALFGKLVGFYPVEAGLAAGLCAADMGGSGDLGILGAANRMELLPFSTIATRIGGALILIVASLVSGLLA